jgi:hypothetical protein
MSRWLSRRALPRLIENEEGPRHGMGELGAEPGAAAEACCEDHAQRQIKLAVNYITGGRSKRDWKLKDLTQTDTGEDAKPHSK